MTKRNRRKYSDHDIFQRLVGYWVDQLMMQFESEIEQPYELSNNEKLEMLDGMEVEPLKGADLKRFHEMKDDPQFADIAYTTAANHIARMAMRQMALCN